jgi:hypothetical protein
MKRCTAYQERADILHRAMSSALKQLQQQQQQLQSNPGTKFAPDPEIGQLETLCTYRWGHHENNLWL